MRILTSSLITLILIAGGAVIFKVSPSKCASIRGDDTLFVLTGDSRRIPYAMKLLEHHPHRRLEIIGVVGMNMRH